MLNLNQTGGFSQMETCSGTKTSRKACDPAGFFRRKVSTDVRHPILMRTRGNLWTSWWKLVNWMQRISHPNFASMQAEVFPGIKNITILEETEPINGTARVTLKAQWTSLATPAATLRIWLWGRRNCPRTGLPAGAGGGDGMTKSPPCYRNTPTLHQQGHCWARPTSWLLPRRAVEHSTRKPQSLCHKPIRTKSSHRCKYIQWFLLGKD